MTRDASPPAIVIGSGVVSLGVINDLTADGVPVVHISPKDHDIALRSRWPIEKVLLQANQDLVDALMKVLTERASDWHGGCLIPTIDPTIRVVSKQNVLLRQRYKTTIQNWCTLQRLVDKAELYKTAASLNVSIPAILSPGELDNWPEWVESVDFPLIVKPVQTPEFFKVFGVKALQANNVAELRRHLSSVRFHDLEVMVSEIVPGDPQNLVSYRCYRDGQGEVRAEMCTQKIRSHPPDFGVGLVHRTIPMISKLREDTQKLLDSYDFHGFSNTEYKLDAVDGKYKLMEINPRPVNCQRLFRKAGINFAKIIYDDATGNPLRANYSYRTDVYGIYNSADLYHIRRFFRQGLKGIIEFLSPYARIKKVLFLPPIRDFGPFKYEMKRILFGKVKRLRNPPAEKNKAAKGA